MHESPLKLVDLESVEISDRTQKWYFLWWSIFFQRNKMVVNQSFPNELSQNYIMLYKKFYVPWMKSHMTPVIKGVCIFMYRLQVRQFSFSEICRQNRHFEYGYHQITISFQNRTETQNTSVEIFRKRNESWITCNNPGIVKLTSVQNIFPRSRFCTANSLPCQVATGLYPIDRKILHGMGSSILIRWPNLLCKPSMMCSQAKHQFCGHIHQQWCTR